MEATKYDDGKMDPSYISIGFVEAQSRGHKYGEAKYARDNYRSGKGLSVFRLLKALARHTVLRMNGQKIDDESGLDHADHIAATANMICETLRRFPENDDVPEDFVSPRVLPPPTVPEGPSYKTVQVSYSNVTAPDSVWLCFGESRPPMPVKCQWGSVSAFIKMLIEVCTDLEEIAVGNDVWFILCRELGHDSGNMTMLEVPRVG